MYPAPGDPHGMIDLCTWMDPSLLDAPEITKKMIGNRPNTYTFTKVRWRRVMMVMVIVVIAW